MNRMEDNSLLYYEKNAQDYFEKTVNVDMHSIYDRFQISLKGNEHILDAGAGSGRDTKYFLSKGFKVTAIDAVEEMVELGRRYTGAAIQRLNFYDINYDQEFDAIWASGSLVHIPRKDMGKILLKLGQALKKNGIFYLSFKYGDRKLQDGERFFNNYTEETFSELIEKIGVFNILEVWLSDDKLKREEKWLNIILKKYQ